jgi:hypothetical protein
MELRQEFGDAPVARPCTTCRDESDRHVRVGRDARSAVDAERAAGARPVAYNTRPRSERAS